MKKFVKIKQNNKKRLADFIEEKRGIKLNTKSMFDIQIKRIHEYKRQLMFTLYAITQYNRIKANPDGDLYREPFWWPEKPHRDTPWPNCSSS
jgi:glycogen phosphorylase